MLRYIMPIALLLCTTDVYAQQDTGNAATPMRAFLEKPVRMLRIVSGTMGSAGGNARAVDYIATGDSMLTAVSMTVVSEAETAHIPFDKTINGEELRRLLTVLYAHPDSMPGISDFAITEYDRVRYIDELDRQYGEDEEPAYKGAGWLTRTQSHTALTLVDTLGPEGIKAMLREPDVIWNTGAGWLQIDIINASDDTVHINKSFSQEPKPWMLPLPVVYRGYIYTCYQPAVARYLGDAMPAGFTGKRAFDNMYLIQQAAKYMYKREE